MKNLDSGLLKRFLRLAGDELEGDWVLVGGTLLPAVGLDVRSTVDIDLIALKTKGTADSLLLMGLADKLGLPVETINQAAAFYFEKSGWKRSDLVLLQAGKTARIFRPCLELYWKLKLSRLTEADLLDCQHYFLYCKAQNERIQRRFLQDLLEEARMKKPGSDERFERIKILEKLVLGST